MKSRTQTLEAVVIKRSKTAEQDWLLTLFCAEHGRFVAVAKGARKLTSSRISCFEPGSVVSVQIISTRSLPIASQAILLWQPEHQSLKQLKHLAQILEIVDRLFVEEELPERVFAEVVDIVRLANRPPTKSRQAALQQRLAALIEGQGFSVDHDDQLSLLETLAELTNKPMRSFEYLTPKPSLG